MSRHLRYLLAAGALLEVALPASALQAQQASKITVSSPAFKNGQPIPPRFTAYGDGTSIPVSWSAVPASTRSIAIVMDDPDVKQSKPFVHWVIYNIPPQTKRLEAGLPTEPKLDQPSGALQGVNSRSSVGYFGPRPPQGDPPHHYHVKVFALDQKLELEPGASEAAVTKAMAGHVLGRGEMVGTVQKP